MPSKGKGHRPDKFDANDKSVSMDLMDMKTANLPKAFNIIENAPDGLDSGYEWHCFDQGEPGTCTANAVASAYIYELQRQGQVDLKDYKPSRLFLYYVARFGGDDKGENNSATYYAGLATNPPTEFEVYDSGSEAREVVKIMKGLGAPDEAEDIETYKARADNGQWGTWPYEDIKPTGPKDNQEFPPTSFVATAPDKECFEQAQNYLALNYTRPHLDSSDPATSIRCWKGCIKSGYPVIFGVRTYKSYDDVNEAPYFVSPVPSSAERNTDYSGHTVLAIGWNDAVQTSDDTTEGCFLIQNSWGTEDTYKDQGHYWMPYGWFEHADLLDSPWTFMGSTVKPRRS